MAGTDLKYTYLSKGTYWRFRHKLTGDLPLPHDPALHWSEQPSRSGFMERYAELLAVVEARGAKSRSRGAVSSGWSASIAVAPSSAASLTQRSWIMGGRSI
ncbi:hypothetical protein GCM10020258_34600 [Sphingomonas yabuuchiae]